MFKLFKPNVVLLSLLAVVPVTSALPFTADIKQEQPVRETREPEAATGLNVKQVVIGKSHMVAAANPYASQAGFNMLEKGGSAIDAAIAIQLVLTLVEPQSSGIGGGAFIMHWHG